MSLPHRLPLTIRFASDPEALAAWESASNVVTVAPHAAAAPKPAGGELKPAA